ncbi:hypothetical protein TNCV_604961 [Trichonephila clavipes]|nr:hypothetical protein TNCV_604961 [Trichonephila clavipes]
MTSYEWRINRWMHYHIHLPLQIPDSLPLKYVPLLIQVKYSSLDNGEGGLVVVKGQDQKKMFTSYGIPVICLDTLECSMVKAYRFARYMQQFNRVYAECEKKLPDMYCTFKRPFTKKERGIE